jgi:hypothetical protein
MKFETVMCSKENGKEGEARRKIQILCVVHVNAKKTRTYKNHATCYMLCDGKMP